MFCFQCQETAKNTGCTVRGVCGKEETTANLQDLLIFNLKGIAVLAKQGKASGVDLTREAGRFVTKALFTTITNVNFNDANLVKWIEKAQEFKKSVKDKVEGKVPGALHESALWFSDNEAEFQEKAKKVGVLATENEDVRSLRELLVIGLKGISAYADHAAILGVEKNEIYDFILNALASTTEDLSVDEMVGMVLKAGECSVNTMAALDQANTGAYGHPEITEVNLGVGANPGILISGHDLKDMDELLKQTRGTGVDVYTHGEMLPANYYPAFKKYDHLKGNYGGSWWHQNEDFETLTAPSS
jgi:hydroxylamine reductase